MSLTRARKLGGPSAVVKKSWPDDVRELIATQETFAAYTTRFFGRALDRNTDESGALEAWTDTNVLDLVAEHTLSTDAARRHPSWGALVRDLARAYKKVGLDPDALDEFVKPAPAGKKKTLQDFFPGSTFAETTSLHFGRELDGPIPGELWSLGKLIGLEFEKCPVVLIPDEIAKLENCAGSGSTAANASRSPRGSASSRRSSVSTSCGAASSACPSRSAA